ncbi:MAG: phospholipase A [Pseudomonadales bacterium]|jgi:phospholipase A1|nr:phospholipase A [Pseudomonadales bacterium]
MGQRMRKGFHVVRTTALASGLAAWGATAVAASLQDCAGVAEAAARLACFDRLAAEAASTRIAETPVAATAPAATEGVLHSRFRKESNQLENPFGLTAYKPNYILPVTYNSKIHREPWTSIYPDAQMDDVEAKFQISFKAQLWDISERFGLWAAYTQESWWQVYNDDESAPFRETNYQPEIFLSYGTHAQLFGFRVAQLNLGFNHQSNGRSDPLSRSWNRIVAGALLERDNLAISPRAWYRLPEDDEDDDNPDTEDYYGYGDLRIAYVWHDMTFSTLLRNNLQSDDNRGALQLDWSFPLNRRFKGYVQYFHGYGESLIDYDVKTSRIGVGVMLTDWL